ncbi:MAG: isocitrate lyase [Chlamydiae bacterium]|nr:isocitrate lyase [Chlamydiota bacterium]
MYKIVQKITSILLCLSFFSYDVSSSFAQETHLLNPITSAQGGKALVNSSLSLESVLEDLKIPYDFGEVIEKSAIPNRPLVFLIEDVHCHSEVQLNIRRILNTLLRANLSMNSHAKLNVLLEAAEGPMDMSFFTAFPDKEVLKIAQDQFLKNNDVTGVESFLMTEGASQAQGVGIEDLSSYVNNVRLMGELIQENEVHQADWQNLDEVFGKLREKIYSKDLLEFVQKKSDYENLELDVNDYEAYLSSVYQKTFQKNAGEENPTLGSLEKLRKLEVGFDENALRQEYLSYLKILEKNLSKDELTKVLRNVLEYRLGRESDQDHYLFLSQYFERVKGQSHGDYNNMESGVKEYRNLESMFSQMLIMKELSWERLEAELLAVENKLMETLAGSANEKALLSLEKDHGILKRIVAFEGKREDIKTAFSVQRSADRKDNSGFVENLVQRLKSVTQENHLSFSSPDFGKTFSLAKKFYQQVLDRDRIFLDKALKEIKERKLSNAALVVGGFHTSGLKEAFKKAHVGYWVIAPRYTQHDDRSAYFKKMKEQFGFLGGSSDELATMPWDTLVNVARTHAVLLLPERVGQTLVQIYQDLHEGQLPDFQGWEAAVPALADAIAEIERRVVAGEHVANPATEPLTPERLQTITGLSASQIQTLLSPNSSDAETVTTANVILRYLGTLMERNGYEREGWRGLVEVEEEGREGPPSSTEESSKGRLSLLKGSDIFEYTLGFFESVGITFTILALASIVALVLVASSPVIPNPVARLPVFLFMELLGSYFISQKLWIWGHKSMPRIYVRMKINHGSAFADKWFWRFNVERDWDVPFIRQKETKGMEAKEVKDLFNTLKDAVASGARISRLERTAKIVWQISFGVSFFLAIAQYLTTHDATMDATISWAGIPFMIAFIIVHLATSIASPPRGRLSLLAGSPSQGGAAGEVPSNGVTLVDPEIKKYSDILSPEVLAMTAKIDRATRDERKVRKEEEEARIAGIRRGEQGVKFLDPSETIPSFQGESWTVEKIRTESWTGAIPQEVVEASKNANTVQELKAWFEANPQFKKWAKVVIQPDELTGPGDGLNKVAYALNGVKGSDGKAHPPRHWMVDFEDALKLRDVIKGVYFTTQALNEHPDFLEEETKKGYGHHPKNYPLVIARPSGVHLDAAELMVDGESASATVVAVVSYLVNNYQALTELGQDPFLYLPKINSVKDAYLWDKILSLAEDEMNLPRGTVKTQMLVERVYAMAELEEIMWVLRHRMIAINVGRYDYANSWEQAMQGQSDVISPDWKQMTMDKAFLRNYVERVGKLAAKHSILFIGGMAQQIPEKNEAANQRAMAKVKADKLTYEYPYGVSGAWMAHPGMVETLQAASQEGMHGKPNQLGLERGPVTYTPEDLAGLLEPHPGVLTEEGIRAQINMKLQYVASYLSTGAAVAVYDAGQELKLMQDRATDETAYNKLWAAMHKLKATLQDGRHLNPELFDQLLADELRKVKAGENSAVSSTYYDVVAEVLSRVVKFDTVIPWFTDILHLVDQLKDEKGVIDSEVARRAIDTYLNVYKSTGRRLTRPDLGVFFRTWKGESRSDVVARVQSGTWKPEILEIYDYVHGVPVSSHIRSILEQMNRSLADESTNLSDAERRFVELRAWVRDGVVLENGRKLDEDLLLDLFDEEISKIRKQNPEAYAKTRYPAIALILEQALTAEYQIPSLGKVLEVIRDYKDFEQARPRIRQVFLHYSLQHQIEQEEIRRNDSRFKGINRLDSAQDVVGERGTVRNLYHRVNTLSGRLFDLLKTALERGESVSTYETSTVPQLIEQGVELPVAYVGDTQRSQDPIVRRVSRFAKAQELHDRKDLVASYEKTGVANMSGNRFRPIIASADLEQPDKSSHINVRKRVRELVQAGASGVKLSNHSYDHSEYVEGHVLLSTEDFVGRLNTARNTADILGVSTVLMASIDTEDATLIESMDDKTDQPFILGVTGRGVTSLKAFIIEKKREAMGTGSSLSRQDWINLTSEWKAQAGLMTYYEAVERAILIARRYENNEDGRGNALAAWREMRHAPLAAAKAKAKELGFGDVRWNAENARTPENYYQVKGGVDMAIAIAKKSSDFSDILLRNGGKKDLAETVSEAKQFADEVNTEGSERKILAFSWPLSTEVAGLTPEELTRIPEQLGQFGYALQLVPEAGPVGEALAIKAFSHQYAKPERQMEAYTSDVQHEELKAGAPMVEHQGWSGADLVDYVMKAITGGTTSTGIVQQGSTIDQFSKKASPETLTEATGALSDVLAHASTPTETQDPEFQERVRKIEEKFARDKEKNGIERPYSAETVAVLQGTLPDDYSRSQQVATKLRRMFKRHQEEGTLSSTFGALDGNQIETMVMFLTSIYVSGWQASSTAGSNLEGGPDIADYPYDTLPNKVRELMDALIEGDQKQVERYLSEVKGVFDEGQKLRIPLPLKDYPFLPFFVDFFAPIIADADTGHGGLTAVMKLTKMFVEAGAAAIHIEDQKAGTKKCGHMGGKVGVALQEHEDRLVAVQLIADMMGVDLVIVARTDMEAAKLLDTNIHPSDHAFITGTTNEELESLNDVIKRAQEEGKTPKQLEEITKAWLKEANLVTYADAVEAIVSKNGISPIDSDALELWRAVNHPLEEVSVEVAEKIAQKLGFDLVKFIETNPQRDPSYLNALQNAVRDFLKTQSGKENLLSFWNAIHDRTRGLSWDAAKAFANVLGYDPKWSAEKPRTREGFYQLNAKREKYGIRYGIMMSIVRLWHYAPRAHVLWVETGNPDVKDAATIAKYVHKKFPKKWLAYNCSPSFVWSNFMTPDEIAQFQRKLGELGYVWVFITLAGIHIDAFTTDRLAKLTRTGGPLALIKGVWDMKVEAEAPLILSALQLLYEQHSKRYQELVQRLNGGNEPFSEAATIFFNQIRIIDGKGSIHPYLLDFLKGAVTSEGPRFPKERTVAGEQTGKGSSPFQGEVNREHRSKATDQNYYAETSRRNGVTSRTEVEQAIRTDTNSEKVNLSLTETAGEIRMVFDSKFSGSMGSGNVGRALQSALDLMDPSYRQTMVGALDAWTTDESPMVFAAFDQSRNLAENHQRDHFGGVNMAIPNIPQDFEGLEGFPSREVLESIRDIAFAVSVFHELGHEADANAQEEELTARDVQLTFALLKARGVTLEEYIQVMRRVVAPQSLYLDVLHPHNALTQEEVESANRLLNHLSSEALNIPENSTLVILGNPDPQFPGQAVEAIRKLNPSRIIIVGKGGGDRPEWERIRNAILEMDPLLESKILTDSGDVSMNTGQNVSSVAKIFKDNSGLSPNVVLVAWTAGDLLARRIFEKQWAENASKQDLSGVNPTFYSSPVQTSFTLTAGVRLSETALSYLERATGQIGRLGSWGGTFINQHDGDLPASILEDARVVQAALNRITPKEKIQMSAAVGKKVEPTRSWVNVDGFEEWMKLSKKAVLQDLSKSQDMAQVFRDLGKYLVEYRGSFPMTDVEFDRLTDEVGDRLALDRDEGAKEEIRVNLDVRTILQEAGLSQMVQNVERAVRRDGTPFQLNEEVVLDLSSEIPTLSQLGETGKVVARESVNELPDRLSSPKQITMQNPHYFAHAVAHLALQSRLRESEDKLITGVSGRNAVLKNEVVLRPIDIELVRQGQQGLGLGEVAKRLGLGKPIVVAHDKSQADLEQELKGMGLSDVYAISLAGVEEGQRGEALTQRVGEIYSQNFRAQNNDQPFNPAQNMMFLCHEGNRSIYEPSLPTNVPVRYARILWVAIIATSCDPQKVMAALREMGIDPTPFQGSLQDIDTKSIKPISLFESLSERDARIKRAAHLRETSM